MKCTSSTYVGLMLSGPKAFLGSILIVFVRLPRRGTGWNLKKVSVSGCVYCASLIPLIFCYVSGDE